jgi:hypothetical protein
MTNCQSWPQLGASTMIACWKPAVRSSAIALLVAAVQAVALVLPYGSLPMFRMT